MKYFSVPADFKKATIDEYARLNEAYPDAKVIDTYGNISVDNRMESGRVIDQLPQVDILDLAEYIDYSRSRGIGFNYTLNAPSMQNREFTREGLRDMRNFLAKLHKAGVRSLTISLPPLIEFVQSLPFDFKIRASTLCYITNANKAAAFKKKGLEKIVVDEAINKDFFTLKKICRVFGPGVEVIVNPICQKNCNYRMFHYNQISKDSVADTSRVSTNYYEHRCVLQRFESPGHLLRISWIRPEDLHYYTAVGVNYFKLQGRHTFHKGGDIVRTVKVYMDQSFDGDLMELFTLFSPLNNFKVRLENKKLDGFIKPFFEKKDFCRDDCSQCGYCDSFARKCVDHESGREIISAARQFYDEYDQYTKLMKEVIDEIPGQTPPQSPEESPDIDFDL